MKKLCRVRLLLLQEGATAIEYAIVLPILLLLIMGIIEYSLVMYGEAVIEGATNYAARLAKTGYVNAATTGTCPSPSSSNTQTQVAYINCIVGTRVAGLLTSSSVQVSASDYPAGYSSISGVGYPTSNCTDTVNTSGPGGTQSPALCAGMGGSNLGSAGDIMVFTVQYPWQVITPFLKNVLGTNGIFMLRASAVVKNEPYSTSR